MVEISRQQVIQSAERLVRRGRIEAAIDEYRKVLHDEPDDTRTLNRVGDLFLRLDKMQQAIDLFCRAADHFSRQGFFVKAIAIYKKVIRVDPTRIEAYEELADLYQRQGLLNEARSQYQVVADYYGQQGDRGSQLKIYRKMAELDPEDPSPRLRLAEAYIADNRPQDAMEQYRLIAALMLAHGRVEDASRVYHRALQLDPSDLGFVTDAVLELKERGSSTAARQLLDSSVALNPAAARVRDLVNLSGRDVAQELAAGPAEAPVAPPRAPAPVEEPAPPEEVAEEPEVEIVEEPVDEISGNLADFAEEEVEKWAAGAALEPEPAPAPTEVDSTVFFLDLDDPAMKGASQAPGGGVEFEIGLDELETGEGAGEPPASRAAGPAVEKEAPIVEEISFDHLDIDLRLEEPAEDAGEQVLELIAEAQVLATYGLDEAAAERFEKVVALEPQRLETYLRLAEIHVQARDLEKLESVVSRVHEVAPETDDPSIWGKLRALLEGEGYGLEAGRVVGGVVARRAADESAEDEAPAEVGAPEAALEAPETTAPVEEPSLTAEETTTLEETAAELAAASEKAERDFLAASEPTAPAAEPAAEEPGSSPFLEEAASAGLDDGARGPAFAEAEVEPAPRSPEPVEEPVAAEASDEAIEDSAIRWLDELAGDAAARKAVEEQMFGQEQEFFDLAAELEEELREEEQRRGEPIAPPPVEQSLEEIVEGFKEGVAATLAKEDYDTHYNLGVAYREMGLIDEAIGEFQLAAKDPRYLVDSCSLLGACFLEKGFGELAIKWYKRGLDSPAITEDETLGLLYEMGNLYLALGDVDQARQTFVDIYGVNSNYRDVVARLEDLR